MADLILVPTEHERKLILKHLSVIPKHWMIQTIGFGVIAAGQETVRLLSEQQPKRVVLAGIAGCFGGESEIASSVWFDAVWIDGIGIGRESSFQDAVQLGWNWYDADRDDGALACWNPMANQGQGESQMMLTVCAASADQRQAESRRERFPGVTGEDMEAFPVVLACQKANVPIGVLRGFSNHVGDREHAGWKIDEALQSVASQLKALFDHDRR